MDSATAHHSLTESDGLRPSLPLSTTKSAASGLRQTKVRHKNPPICGGPWRTKNEKDLQ